MNESQKLLNIFNKALIMKIIAANDLIDRVSLTDFYYKLEKFLRSEGYKKYSTMGPIIICLNSVTPGTGANILDDDRLCDYLKSGATRISNVYKVDYSGRLIENPGSDLIDNPSDAAQTFNQDDTTLFFIAGERLDVYYKAKIVDYIPNIFTHNRSVIVSDMTLPVSDYRALINAHFEKRINKKSILQYWKKKSERLLVSAPEKIFGSDLGSYLDQYVADGHVDRECYNAWTDDRTDIRIVRYVDRHIYIIEVKWLGTSESKDGKKTHCTDSRANSGIVQLNVYLKAENLAICGVLVVYDARDKDIDIKYNSGIKRDARIVEPMRFYLISESASVEGDRIAKESKPKRPYKDS